jgi:NAD(P)-dependent dehydrogenase (short-subunit alcohol dehydrogenase family)
MINTENKTILITGASRGLGFALTQAFLDSTEHTVVAVSRNTATLRALGSGRNYKGRLHFIEADICNAEDRERIRECISGLPSIGVVVHNAGALLFKPFMDIGIDELRAIYDVNVFAPFMLTQKLMPHMDAAHVISISSVGGVEGSLKYAGLSAYSSSKAALNCLTEMWSEEFKESEHCFNCLALGSVETEMFREAFPGVPAASRPEEMASYIVNFAFEAPKVMRGKIISLSRSNP